MSEKHENLTTLLLNNSEANQFFYDLPEHVKEEISSRSDNINTLENLQSIANKLTRGMS